MLGYIRFTAVAICLIFTLTGCATKEAVKIDTAQSPAAATVSSVSKEPVNAEEAIGDKFAATALAENLPKSDAELDQFSQVKAETHLDPIYFDFDSYLLSVEARDVLSRNAGWLSKNSNAKIIVEGHADERGSDEYNLALGEKRALAARRYIETLGVIGGRMETVSYGEERPAVTGHDEEDWAKNRRVEFVIVK